MSYIGGFLFISVVAKEIVKNENFELTVAGFFLFFFGCNFPGDSFSSIMVFLCVFKSIIYNIRQMIMTKPLLLQVERRSF
jgi:hypothetical protein